MNNEKKKKNLLNLREKKCNFFLKRIGKKNSSRVEKESKRKRGMKRANSKRAASVDVDGRHGRRALRTRMHTIVS